MQNFLGYSLLNLKSESGMQKLKKVLPHISDDSKLSGDFLDFTYNSFMNKIFVTKKINIFFDTNMLGEFIDQGYFYKIQIINSHLRASQTLYQQNPEEITCVANLEDVLNISPENLYEDFPKSFNNLWAHHLTKCLYEYYSKDSEKGFLIKFTQTLTPKQELFEELTNLRSDCKVFTDAFIKDEYSQAYEKYCEEKHFAESKKCAGESLDGYYDHAPHNQSSS